MTRSLISLESQARTPWVQQEHSQSPCDPSIKKSTPFPNRHACPLPCERIGGILFAVKPNPHPATRSLLAAFLAAAACLAAPLAGADGPAQPYPEDSPEHQALSLASPFLGDEAFKLRNEYWTGRLSTTNGRAVRLQFFKGNLYRLFLGVAPAGLAPGARLKVHVVDERSEVVASAEGEPGAAAVALFLEEPPRTGLYLVLMTIDAGPGPLAELEAEAVLFYGWK